MKVIFAWGVEGEAVWLSQLWLLENHWNCSATFFPFLAPAGKETWNVKMLFLWFSVSVSEGLRHLIRIRWVTTWDVTSPVISSEPHLVTFKLKRAVQVQTASFSAPVESQSCDLVRILKQALRSEQRAQETQDQGALQFWKRRLHYSHFSPLQESLTYQ